jgi:hypothetical protein
MTDKTVTATSTDKGTSATKTAKPTKPTKAPAMAPAAPAAPVAPVAPAKPTKAPSKTKAKPAKKNAVKRGVGRPKANLKLILNKTFSLADMFAINPGSHKLTVRRHITDGVKAGVFTKLAKKVATGKRGKPADLFINTKVLSANRTNLTRVKAKADAVVADAVNA